MNDVPRNDDPSDDIDDLYRRAAALDPSRPSESVRNAILSHADQSAAEHRTPRQSDRAKRFVPTRRRALFGTLAAAVLAGLIVIPQFLLTHNEPRSPANVAHIVTIEPSNALKSPPPAPYPDAPPSSAPAPLAAPSAPSPAPAAPLVAAAPPPRAPHAPVASEVAPARTSPPPLAGRAASVAGQGTPLVAQAAPPTPAAAPPTTAAPLPKASSIAPQADASRERVQAYAPLQSTTVTAAAVSPPSLAATSAAPSAVAAPAPAPAPAYTDEALSEVVRTELTVHPAANSPVSQAVLRRAAERGDITKVQATLNLGVDVNARDAADRTALLLAVMNNRSAVVDVLLAHGADANAADRSGTTPLQAAESSHQSGIAAALRAAGAH